VAEAGNVGGTSVGGGDAVRATTLTVGVPSTVTLTVCCRLKKKIATAMTTISTPSARATQGQRFDGSPGSTGWTTGGVDMLGTALSACSGPSPYLQAQAMQLLHQIARGLALAEYIQRNLPLNLVLGFAKYPRSGG
jgi:hypothetical protein